MAAAPQAKGDEGNPAAAAGAGGYADLTAFDSSSTLALNYEGWDRLLSHAVKTPEELNAGKQNYESFGTGSRIGGGSNRSTSPTYVVDMVNYARLGDNFRAALGELIEDFSVVEVSALNRDQQLAYWLNLYNAAFLAAVADRYPIDDMEDLMGDAKDPNNLLNVTHVEVDGTDLTLREIRDKILAPNWNTPLILYGLFTATQDGPNMSVTAYTGENVHALLEASAREFINSYRGVKVLHHSARVSEIYQWPGPLFKNRTALLNHLRRYADSRLKRDLRKPRSVGHLSFDWGLNELPGDTAGTTDTDLEGYHPPLLVDTAEAD